MKRTAEVSLIPAAQIGTYGHLTLFLWSLALVMLAPEERIPIAAAICLGMEAVISPISFRRLLTPRFLLLCVLLALPPIFWVGEPDLTLGPVGISSEGITLAVQILLRAIVVLVAVGGLTASVEISSLAGLVERLGLKGLGFSVGVALNLLPALRQSVQNTWRSLWMRGGLRRQGLRGLQLFAVTVITNALRWAEEVALAAEARAFSPEQARALPVKRAGVDKIVLVACALSLAAIVFIP